MVQPPEAIPTAEFVQKNSWKSLSAAVERPHYFRNEATMMYHFHAHTIIHHGQAQGEIEQECICLAVDSTFKCRATKLIVGKPSPKYMKRGKGNEGRTLSWLKCLAEKRGGMNLSIESETDKRESPTGRACALSVNLHFKWQTIPPQWSFFWSRLDGQQSVFFL